MKIQICSALATVSLFLLLAINLIDCHSPISSLHRYTFSTLPFQFSVFHSLQPSVSRFFNLFPPPTKQDCFMYCCCLEYLLLSSPESPFWWWPSCLFRSRYTLLINNQQSQWLPLEAVSKWRNPLTDRLSSSIPPSPSAEGNKT